MVTIVVACISNPYIRSIRSMTSLVISLSWPALDIVLDFILSTRAN